MKNLFTIVIASAILYSCGSSQTKSEAKATVKPQVDVTKYGNTITEAELKTALYKYASDEFLGRETGKPGQKMAVNYLRDTYISLGIAAAKSDGNYFQDVALEINDVPTVSITNNGKEFKNIDDFVSVTSSGTGVIDAKEVVYAGFGIEDDKYNDFTGLDIKGKVVLIKSGEPKKEDGTFVITGTEEASKWSNFRQQFASKRDIAKAKGAKAVFFYYPEVYAMASNRFGTSSGRMSLAGKADDMYYFLVNTAFAESLIKDISTNNTAKTISTTLKVDYKNNAKPLQSENVAAFIKGSEKPDEIIVISAHLDHEGVKEGEIYNGADDDGSGTVAVLEIAEAFAEARKDGNGPKRSILFLNVTGEEKGLLGSAYYTDVDPIFPLANTVANLNIDMIGRTDPKREKRNRDYLYLIGSDKLSTELHNISEEANTKYMNIDLDYTFNDDNDPNRFYYRSDHYNFAKNNIPVIFYFNGTHDDYHQPSDTPDKIQYDLLENRTRLIFYTAWEVANRAERLVVDKTTN
jgi:hypothetical protein